MSIFDMYGLKSFRSNLMKIRNIALKAANNDEAGANAWAIVLPSTNDKVGGSHLCAVLQTVQRGRRR